MAGPSRREIAEALLERHGRTFADELGIDVAKGKPSALWRLLCAALLMSARIRASIAIDAARALARAGWTTAEKLAASSWQERVDAVHDAGYARYDERTATMLGDTAEHALELWGGDLRKLREEAGRDPGAERRLLKEFKGMGDVGVDIFFREAQAAWEELRPFLDKRALRAAGRLGLGDDARSVAGLVDDEDVARLAAALVRCELDKDHDAVLEAAGR